MDEMPPVENRPLYVYRVLMKWLSFFIFGFSSVLIMIFVLPVLRLTLHGREEFQKCARRFISACFRVFIRFMHFLRVVDMDPGEAEPFRRLSSKIVVANHPSILDVVMLISLIPNADCIVRGTLTRTLVRGIVRQLYILTSLNFQDLLKECVDSLNQGNCLIIFPEGTRTPRSGKLALKKGAARISLLSGCGVVPVHIGGTDKYGLGKKDPWTAYNHRDRYVYRIQMLEELSPEKYRDLPNPVGVRNFHHEICSVLFDQI
ncbi:1-acyl-sn-glycerol-3-phosphate acyltransferase [Treponema primitia]|uniref:lysophospholipid acyltransferase family protein n=1 Tax=Treponema primitia TaxID=88058 RepID=UPI00397FCAB3